MIPATPAAADLSVGCIGGAEAVNNREADDTPAVGPAGPNLPTAAIRDAVGNEPAELDKPRHVGAALLLSILTESSYRPLVNGAVLASERLPGQPPTETPDDRTDSFSPNNINRR